MTPVPHSPDAGGRTRSVLSAARRWCVFGLIIAVLVIEVVMLIGHDSSAPKGGWLWPIVAAAAAVCWLFTRSRTVGRLLLLVQLVVLWSGVLFPSGPIDETRGVRDGLDQALLAVGAAGFLRCLTAAMILLGCIAAFVPFGAAPGQRRPRGITILTGLLAAALVVGISIPAGYGLRAISRSRVVASAEQSEVLDRPDTTGVSTAAVGSRQGWSRPRLAAVQPVGDRVIGIESGKVDHGNATWHAVVALRAGDGALLWRYRAKGTAEQDSVGPAIIDPDSRTIMIKLGGTLTGLDFDGQVRYHQPLDATIDPRAQPILVGDVLGDAAPSLQIGAVGVFGGNYARTPGGFAAGYAVATGERVAVHLRSQGLQFCPGCRPGDPRLPAGGREATLQDTVDRLRRQRPVLPGRVACTGRFRCGPVVERALHRCRSNTTDHCDSRCGPRHGRTAVDPGRQEDHPTGHPGL